MSELPTFEGEWLKGEAMMADLERSHLPEGQRLTFGQVIAYGVEGETNEEERDQILRTRLEALAERVRFDPSYEGETLEAAIANAILADPELANALMARHRLGSIPVIP